MLATAGWNEQSSINELVKRLDVDQAGWDGEKARLEQQIAEAAKNQAAKSGTLAAALNENRRLIEEVAGRQAREAKMHANLKQTLDSLQQAMKTSDETVCLLVLKMLVPHLSSGSMAWHPQAPGKLGSAGVCSVCCVPSTALAKQGCAAHQSSRHVPHTVFTLMLVLFVPRQERALNEAIPIFDSMHQQVLANCGYTVK